MGVPAKVRSPSLVSRLREQVWKRLPNKWLKPVSRQLRRLTRPAWLGTLRRTTPLSARWGSDRGTPIDRYYIERFLEEHREDIRGRVLEVHDCAYTQRFGRSVETRNVLDIDPANPRATIVADLANAQAVPANQFDCFILTQTLQFIYDVRAAIRHAHRILSPGGVLLVTVPSVSRIDPTFGLDADLWRFTAAACRSLFTELFDPDRLTVRSYGNVLTAIGFLAGLASEELSQRELEAHDRLFPVLIAVRAVKK